MIAASFGEFEMRCFSIDTRTDAALRIEDCNIDSCSVRDSRANRTTAGEHILRAKSTGILTTYLTDVELNMRQINNPDASMVQHLTQNDLVQIKNIKQSMATRFAITDKSKLEEIQNTKMRTLYCCISKVIS